MILTLSTDEQYTDAKFYNYGHVVIVMSQHIQLYFFVLLVFFNL